MAHAPGLQRNQSLQRAVDVLRALSAAGAGASASDLARRASLTVPTTRRLLATLDDAGLAERLPDSGRWVLGHELVRLARAADPHRAAVGAARPHLERLAAETGEAALLGVDALPAAVEVLCQVDPPATVGIGSWLGRHTALHASAGGRLALAARSDDEVRAILGPGPLPRHTDRTITDVEAYLRELRRVRREGVAVSVDELEVGLAAVAVPVRGPGDGRDGYAVGVSAPTVRLSRERRRELLPRLRACAAAIGAGLAGR